MHYRAINLECFPFCSFGFVNIPDLVIRLKKRFDAYTFCTCSNVLLRELLFTLNLITEYLVGQSRTIPRTIKVYSRTICPQNPAQFYLFSHTLSEALPSFFMLWKLELKAGLIELGLSTYF